MHPSPRPPILLLFSPFSLCYNNLQENKILCAKKKFWFKLMQISKENKNIPFLHRSAALFCFNIFFLKIWNIWSWRYFWTAKKGDVLWTWKRKIIFLNPWFFLKWKTIGKQTSTMHFLKNIFMKKKKKHNNLTQRPKPEQNFFFDDFLPHMLPWAFSPF